MANEGQSKRGENCHCFVCVTPTVEDVHYVDTMFSLLVEVQSQAELFEREAPSYLLHYRCLTIIFLLESMLGFLFERRQ